MANLGFYYNQDLCIGCRTCQIACKDANNLPIGALFLKVCDFEQGQYPTPGYYHYLKRCNHCAEPACVINCPSGAMYKADDGTVQRDAEKCIGCMQCASACPYEVPFLLEEENVSGKCFSCKDLRDQGELPACVAACTTRALDFGDLDELAAKYGDGLIKDLPILPSSDTTNPSTLIQPRACALESDFTEAQI